jgi:hypothetical protein
MVAQYVVASRGVGDIQRNLYYPDLRGSWVVVPPPEEQAAIVRFLDHSNRKIDAFLRAKRKLIALLNEALQNAPSFRESLVTESLDRDLVTLLGDPVFERWRSDVLKH